jgi:SAM-dependent methyltransferase
MRNTIISAELKMSPRAQALLQCLSCHSPLISDSAELQCAKCGASYPVCDGVPILINENSSVFRIEDFVGPSQKVVRKASSTATALRRFVPELSKNIKAGTNFRKLADALLKQSSNPIVLVVGGRIVGQGMDELLRMPGIEIVETDVAHGPRTALICDGHDLPFQSEAFDAVIVQAVLEHVLDPARCVNEIYRVLNRGGLVYAEIPFAQQVHARQYDFTRFTHLGLRRLFRKFEELESGATCGPGMALAWSYNYFLLSFARSQRIRAFLTLVARFTAFWCKYIDAFVIDNPGTLDAASAHYFIGRKSDDELTDRELVCLYRGAF